MMMEGGAVETAPLPQGPLERLVERTATVLAVIAGIILVVLALLVAANVLGRWFLNHELTGAFEVVQIGVAVAAFLSLPICQLHNHNIIVDSFTTGLSPRMRAGLDALWAFAYAAIAIILAWRLSLGAEETIRSHMTTGMLRIPYGWAMVVGAAALCFLAFVAVVSALRHLRGTQR